MLQVSGLEPLAIYPATHIQIAASIIKAAAEKIAGQLMGSVPLINVHTLEAAIRHAYQFGTSGDTVLLAPACASFDQFRSYEHRGEVFKQIVNQLEAKS